MGTLEDFKNAGTLNYERVYLQRVHVFKSFRNSYQRILISSPESTRNNAITRV
jgi:hypothetical protein